MVDGRNRINLWLLVRCFLLVWQVQEWRDGALGICSRQDSTKHTAHSLQRPVRHLIKHRLQLSGFVLQGEREGICLPRASFPSHDCSHVVCFNAAISSQLCRHLQPGYSDSWQLFRGPQGQLLSLGSDHTLQNTSGRSCQRWKIPTAAHSQVYGAPGPEDNTGKDQHQQERIQPEVGGSLYTHE